MWQDLEFTVELPETRWHFTSRARLKLWRLGAAEQNELVEISSQLLAMGVLRDGKTELNLSGVGLRITKQGTVYQVETIEE